MRPLPRNRRVAIFCASGATLVAGSSTLLAHANPGISDLAHGLAIGVTLGTSIGLTVLSTLHLRRDRTACSGRQTPGV